MVKSFLSTVGLSLSTFTNILTIGFVVAMIIVMYYYANFYKQQKSIIKDINEVLEEISVLEIKNASDSYEDIKNIFLKSDLLRSAWLSYQKNHFFMKDVSGKSVVYTTEDADFFFNYNNLTNRYNATFWQNLGGVFTGLGILGTFVGLSVVFPSSSNITHLYCIFVSSVGTNSSPLGISSFICFAYPAIFPSLYILIVYSTKSVDSTSTGSFVC